MNNTWFYVKKAIIVVVLTAVCAGAAMIFGNKKSSTNSKPVKVDATVSIEATVDAELKTHFAETYSINSDKVKNGNGRRWLYPPVGTTFQFEGVEDVTSGTPKKIVTASTGPSGAAQEIRWTYPPKSGRQTFIVRYIITGAVRDATDGGHVFSWTFFDNRNPLNVDTFSATLVLPAAATPQVPTFIRLGPKMESLTSSGTTTSWKPGGLKPFTVAEMTQPFALEGASAPVIVPKMTGSSTQAAQTIESQWKSAAAKDRLYYFLGIGLPIGFATVLVLMLIVLQLKYGREYKMDNPPIYERELPTPESPAEVGWLVRFGTVDTKDLTGTIIDLARRRYLRVQEPPDRTEENAILVATPEKVTTKGPLAPHEMRTLNWLFPDPSGFVDFNARKEQLKTDQASWQNFWKGFTQDVSSQGDIKGFIERTGSSCLVAGMAMVGILSMIGGVILAIMWTWFWLALSFAGALTAVGSGGLKKRSRHGAETYEKWMAFKRYIHDFSTIPDAPPAAVVIWEHYLAYAIPLDEGKTVVEYMKLRPPVEGQNDWYPANPGVLLWMGTGIGGWQTAGTPSSSGGGGGFSGGGGGGFGGGGGASFD